MARPLRIEYKGAIYHIISRGNEKKSIFLDGKDYTKLLKIFGQAKDKFSLIFYCYILMPNHYHLVIETPLANLSKAMHDINTMYTVYFNHRHERAGHLFQGRYKALLVDKNNYLLELSRYIHLNSVKADIVERPEDCKWSSYRDYVGLSNTGLVETEFVLSQFSSDMSISERKYRKFCYNGKDIDWEKLNKDVYGKLILGTKEFTQKIKQKIERKELSKEIPLHRKIVFRMSKDKILEIVSREYNENLGNILKKKCEARKLAVYLLRKHTDMSLGVIAKLFGGLHYSSVSWIVENVESTRKSNIELDSRLKRLESKIQNSKLKT